MSDEDRFAAALKEHAPYVRRFLLSRGAPADDVDNLMQTAFLVAWQKRAFVFDGKARQYLTGVARWLLIAHRRKEETRKQLLQQCHEEVARQIHPSCRTHSPEMRDLQAERQRHMRQCLDQLPAISREVVELLHLHGMTRKEAAEILGCSLNAIEKREKKALHRLKSTIVKNDDPLR